MSNTKDHIAPDGKIYVCSVCRKTSVDRYGYSKKYPETSWGWDVSCVLNSRLYDKSQLKYDKNGIICKIEGEPHD